MGAYCFGIEMSLLWYRGSLSLLFGTEIFFWYRDSAICVRHQDRPLPGIKPSVFFLASASCKLEVKKDLDTKKKINKS